MALISSRMAFKVSCSVKERPDYYEHLNTPLSFAVKPLLRALQQVPNIRVVHSKTIENTTAKILDAFVNHVFEFVDQPLLPSQRNFAPVEELGGPVVINSIEGNIPNNFPEGVYIRNGSNPLSGGLKSTKSVFGKSFQIWVEGEGMLHALFLSKDKDSNWSLCYNNRYVATETLKLDKQRSKPSFLPAVGGDSLAVISAYLLNVARFGRVNKDYSNTNVFEHSGKLYSIAENESPQEIDISTLETLGNWTLSRAWNRPFSSHPKRAPGTGELVIMGMDIVKPYVEIGVISADGKNMIHRADLKLDRCTFVHDFGVTQRFNVFMDFPLPLDIKRLFLGGPLIKYSKEGYARIGVMPRYGDANSIKWFKVEPNCTFHLFNCFEDGNDEVVVWGCRTLESIIPGPNFDPSSEENIGTKLGDGPLYDRPYEWRLNMRTGEVRERNLTADTEISMDFPMVNENVIGLRNKFGYTQVLDVMASSIANHKYKYGGLAKLHFEPLDTRFSTIGKKKFEEAIKVEYHMFEKNTFCTGAAFVPNTGGLEEDDGWIITFVHNEDINTSQVFVIDVKGFSHEPIATITLPCRVPYGFHGAFIPMS